MHRRCRAGVLCLHRDVMRACRVASKAWRLPRRRRRGRHRRAATNASDTCNTGRKNCRDFDSIESRGKRQGYSSLEAFANDVDDVSRTRTRGGRGDDLVRVGSMDEYPCDSGGDHEQRRHLADRAGCGAPARTERLQADTPAKRDASPLKINNPQKNKGPAVSHKPEALLAAAGGTALVQSHEARVGAE